MSVVERCGSHDDIAKKHTPVNQIVLYNNAHSSKSKIPNLNLLFTFYNKLG